MRPNSTPSRPRHLVSALMLAAMTMMALAACSASGNSAAQDAASSQAATPTAPAAASAIATGSTSAPTAVSTTPATASGLSGTWKGQYSGSYSGTFTLSWQATGSQLNGTIRLSLPDVTSHISGTVAGGSIQFGTVGSGAAITYSGTVSGNSMSGTYQVHDTQGSTGPWSATRSS